MDNTKRKPFPPLSPSALANFEQCPKQWHETKILKKYPFEVTEQITYGNQVHADIEAYIRSRTPLPEHIEHVAPIIDSARASRIVAAELELAIREDWSRCGYWDKDCMLRGKVDFVAVQVTTATAWILDWKTGKRKPDPFQLNVYGSILKHTLNLKAVAVGFVWLKTKEKDVYVVDDTNFEDIRSDITTRIAAMKAAYEASEFEARTSVLCCWCAALDDCKEAIHYKNNKANIRKGR